MGVRESQILLLELPDEGNRLRGRHECQQGIHLRRLILQDLGGEVIGAEVEGFIDGEA